MGETDSQREPLSEEEILRRLRSARKDDLNDRHDDSAADSSSIHSLETADTIRDGGGGSGSGSFPEDSNPGYQILREISAGAQGKVYQAVQIATGQQVAIKVLREGPFASAHSRQRFRREVSAVAALDHPNIVKVIDSGIASENYFYAMQYIHGAKNLDRFVRESNGSTEKILGIFSRICDAIDYAHRRGVVHRDLKPSNIVVDHRGEPHIVDFGLAKVAGGSSGGHEGPMLISISGIALGTLPYMSPEQARGEPEEVDARTDIYSLGVVLYRLLTEEFPYNVNGNWNEVAHNIIHTDPKPPSTIRRKIDKDLETVVLTAIQKEPHRRYQLADTLRRDVEHVLAGEPIEARPDSWTYKIRRKVRRHRLGVVSVSIIALVVAVFGGIAYLSLLQKEQAIELTEDWRLKAEYYQDKSEREEYLAGMSGFAALPVEPPPANWALIDRETTVHINCPGKPEILNSMVMQTTADLFVCELLFERLFRRTDTLELVQNEHLVSEIEETDDPRIRIVHLRPDLRWHDGTQLTAQDIVFSWQQTMSEPVESSKRNNAARLVEVAAKDATTVRFVFSEIDPTWRFSTNFELIPRHRYIEGLEEDPTLMKSEFFQQRNLEPVGCGPFRFVSWGGDDESIILERWEDYEGKKPSVKRLVIHWYDSPDTKLQAFLDGRLDLFPLTTDQYDNIRFEDDFTAIGGSARLPDQTYYYIAWNCDTEASPFFGDVRVRRAMTHAMNIERVTAQVTNNLATPCAGPFAVVSDYYNLDIRRLKYDRQIAAALLDEAGCRFAEDGRRYHAPAPESASREAIPFRFTLLVYQGREEWLQTAEILRQNLAKIDVEAIIERIDWKEYIRRREAGEFDAFLGGTRPPADPDLWRRDFYTDGPRNFGHYSNPEVDKLFDAGMKLFDRQERAACYQEIHSLIYEDQPMTFLYHRPSLWAINKRLRGVSFSVRGPYLFHPGIRQWWVPKD